MTGMQILPFDIFVIFLERYTSMIENDFQTMFCNTNCNTVATMLQDINKSQILTWDPTH